MTLSFRTFIAVTVVPLMCACNAISSLEQDLRHHHPSDLATTPSPADMSASGAGGSTGGGGGGNGTGTDLGSTGAVDGGVAGAAVTAVDPESAPPGVTVALTGRGFQAGDTVQISNATYGTIALATVSVTATVILATLPSSTKSGAANVSVVRSGSSTNSVPFTVTSGHVYYIAPNGSDSNPGTIAQPWLHMDAASSKMHAGDTVYLRGGTYSGAMTITVSGTAAAPMNFIGYPGESAILTNPASNGTAATLTAQGAYLTFDHLKITSLRNPGFAVSVDPSAQYVTFSNCEMYGVANSGVLVIGGHNTFVRNSIHDNGSHDVLDHGIYVDGPYNTVRQNRVFNNWMFGIQLYNGYGAGSPAGHNTIEGNFSYHNGYGAKAAMGIAYSAGIVVADLHTDDVIRNNVLCDNADYAIMVIANQPNNAYTGNVSCYNHSGGFAFDAPGTGNTATGNISYNDAGTALRGVPPLVSDNNTYWKTGGTPTVGWSGSTYSLTAFESKSGQDLHSKVADPQLKNVPSSGFDSTKIATYDFCTPLNPALCN